MEKFDVNYDRSQYVTVADMIAESTNGALFVKTAFREANLVPVGKVFTGSVGKPPLVFRRSEFEAALTALSQKRQTATTVKTEKRRLLTQSDLEKQDQSNEFDLLNETNLTAVG
jgi:hypothetical protein